MDSETETHKCPLCGEDCDCEEGALDTEDCEHKCGVDSDVTGAAI